MASPRHAYGYRDRPRTEGAAQPAAYTDAGPGDGTNAGGTPHSHAGPDGGRKQASVNDAAGHRAAHEATEVLAADIRTFFGSLS